MPSEDASLQRLAATWAGCIARAERPSPFSSRDGSVLRLVPVNERLPQEQLQQGLVQLLTQQQQLVTDFNDLISHTRSRKGADADIQLCRFDYASPGSLCQLLQSVLVC